jgi:hypothetical protein
LKIADSAISNIQAHSTTSSQTSSIECGCRNPSSTSATSERLHTSVVTTGSIGVWRPLITSAGNASGFTVRSHVIATMASVTTDTQVKMAIAGRCFTLAPVSPLLRA